MVEVKRIEREGGEGGETAEEAGSKQAVSHRECYDTATTEIYTALNTLSLHDALPI